MKYVSGETVEEKKLVTGIQKAVGAKMDNSIGPDTLVGLAQKVCPDIFPIDVKIFGFPTLVGKHITALDPNSSIAKYEDSISGSFTYIAGETPCSILVADGKDVWSAASKSWAGYPESVICEYKNGDVRIVRAKTTSDLPDRKNLLTAVGGMGLLNNWNPSMEGFIRFTYQGKTYNHSDVLRDTDHLVLGYKNGFFYGAYFGSLTANQIDDICKRQFMFDFAILLDGGHIAAFNGTDNNINLNQKQGYIVRFV